MTTQGRTTMQIIDNSLVEFKATIDRDKRSVAFLFGCKLSNGDILALRMQFVTLPGITLLQESSGTRRTRFVLVFDKGTILDAARAEAWSIIERTVKGRGLAADKEFTTNSGTDSDSYNHFETIVVGPAYMLCTRDGVLGTFYIVWNTELRWTDVDVDTFMRQLNESPASAAASHFPSERTISVRCLPHYDLAMFELFLTNLWEKHTGLTRITGKASFSPVPIPSLHSVPHAS